MKAADQKWHATQLTTPLHKHCRKLKKEPFLDGFTLLVREKMAGIGVELKELAEHLILNVLTLARLGKLTPEHDILEVMTYNVNA